MPPPSEKCSIYKKLLNTYYHLRICIISIFRAYFNADSTLQKTNFPSYAGIAITLGSLEINLSIICASLPVMQPILNLAVQKLKSSLFSRSSTSNNTPRKGKAYAMNGRRRQGSGGRGLEGRGVKDRFYPLGTIPLSCEGGTTLNTIEGTGSGKVDVEMDELRMGTVPPSAIALERMWDVASV